MEEIYIKCNFCFDTAMMIYLKKRTIHLTLEKALSLICFLAGMAFLTAAVLGLWRHFFTMGLCFAIGVMISDESGDEDAKKKRHE